MIYLDAYAIDRLLDNLRSAEFATLLIRERGMTSFVSAMMRLVTRPPIQRD